ncbi:hypothetical protein BpHYR1_025620 [Brachionus plicatilis]|uniref:Uncharacterized protein n=1 Tax=Brachionus plicatilis TaxID=10195 RepID=A0A3M7SU56_BRAPC|nr:hypothetical protein BpHYR1_025620 [Brachionus plicatilis]
MYKLVLNCKKEKQSFIQYVAKFWKLFTNSDYKISNKTYPKEKEQLKIWPLSFASVSLNVKNVKKERFHQLLFNNVLIIPGIVSGSKREDMLQKSKLHRKSVVYSKFFTVILDLCGLFI